MKKKMIAILERNTGHPQYNDYTENAYATKPQLKAHLDFMRRFGTITICNADDMRPMTVEQIWKIKYQDYLRISIIYLDNESKAETIYNLRFIPLGMNGW